MDNREPAGIQHSKAIRGYIIRPLVKRRNNMALTRQLPNSMIAAGLTVSPDIAKHLNHPKDTGYIGSTNLRVTAYNAYTRDVVMRLTKVDVDLMEGTIKDTGMDA